MEEEKVTYCVECGEIIPEGDGFCPACGAYQKYTPENSYVREEKKRVETEVVESRFNIARMLVVVYAIPAIFAGIFTLIFMDQTAQTIWDDENMRKIFLDIGWSFSGVKDYIMITGILVLAGGVLAGITAYCSYVCKHWVLATVCCFSAAIFALPSIFGCVIGLLVSYMIYKSKELFTD